MCEIPNLMVTLGLMCERESEMPNPMVTLRLRTQFKKVNPVVTLQTGLELFPVILIAN